MTNKDRTLEQTMNRVVRSSRTRLAAKPSAIRIVCISDTHGQHRQLKVPLGDILIHAGDFMLSGRRLEEIVDFDGWLGNLPHPQKIVVAGNHDLLFEAYPEMAQGRLKNATYLENSGAEILGLHFWGSPVQPSFSNWAFNVDRGAAIRRYWAGIPKGTDVIITHGPPFGTLDKKDILSPHLGCEELTKAVAKLEPQLQCFRAHSRRLWSRDGLEKDPVHKLCGIERGVCSSQCPYHHRYPSRRLGRSVQSRGLQCDHSDR
jgi:Icc-related predicted phosphoesterase